MKGIVKKLLVLAIAAVCAAAVCFAACSSNHEEEEENTSQSNSTNQTYSSDSGSGDVTYNINIYNSYPQMTDEQFEKYLEYLSANSASEASAIEAASARSVFSSVSIVTIMMFPYETSSEFGGGHNSSSQISYYYDNVYSGSGVIVDLDKTNGDAYVLTNCHVVYDDTAVTPVTDRVYLYLYGQDIEGQNYNLVYDEDGKYKSGNKTYKYLEYSTTDDDYYRIDATVVAASVQYDLALLKVSDSDVLKNSNAIAASFADDDEVYIGQSVYAVGNPLGAGTTVTTGVVSSDSEETQVGVSSTEYTLYREIKTDTVVNPGNSGGALYNSSGEIIGIVNCGLTSYGTETVQGTSYALPASYVKRVYELMKDTASGSQITEPGISRAYIKGCYSVDSTDYSSYSVQNSISTGYESIYSYSYLDESSGTPRARIREYVVPTTTSYGLEVSDIITHLTITDKQGNTVEDLDITRKYMLDDALISYRSGYTVTLTYNDGEGTKNVTCEMISLS